MLTCIITGCLGMDGVNLTRLMLEGGAQVYGLYRRVSTGTHLENLGELVNHPNLVLVEGDITDASCMTSLIADVKPDVFFSLAAMSHVGYSFKIPEETMRTNFGSTVIQLDAIRRYSPGTRYYFSGTSESYGGLNCPVTGYTEASPFNPRSPYAVAKVSSIQLVRNYREAYGLHLSNGILFNHSAVNRSLDFATRKITHGVASIKAGRQEHLLMGNMSAFRDEGHSFDYTKAMILMLAQDKPDDYVVATGTGATIEQMARYVCELAGLDYNEVYKMDERFMRPSDVPYLLGDASKAREKLGWGAKITWKELLKEMYEHDYKELVCL